MLDQRLFMMAASTRRELSASELDIKRILLLDDDVELGDTLKLLLESHNFVVTIARDGVEGLREVMSLDFDIIMCDMMMPKMPGDMFYLAVERTKPHLCDRFIFITGHYNNPKVTGFLKNLNALVLHKPIASGDLIRAISFVLKRTESGMIGH